MLRLLSVLAAPALAAAFRSQVRIAASAGERQNQTEGGRSGLAWGGPDAPCSADILMEVGRETMRIAAREYSNGPVTVLHKRRANGCVQKYSIVCKWLPTLRKTKENCPLGAYTQDKDIHFPFGMSRVTSVGAGEALTFSPALRIPGFGEETELVGGVITYYATRKTCADAPAGKCLPGCCPDGSACVTIDQQKFGVCALRKWSAEHVCAQPFTNDCYDILAKANKLTTWDLIITTNGGGGHLTAAKNLAKKRRTQWLAEVKEFRSEWEAVKERSALTRSGSILIEKTVDLAVQEDRRTETLNIMETDCFKLAGISVADWSTKQWDEAQAAGDLKKLKSLFKKQWIVPHVFGTQCETYMTSVLDGLVLPHFDQPARVISTQPLLLSSITAAMDKLINKGTLDPLLTIDLFMTDLPTPSSIHFFEDLKGLRRDFPHLARNIRLHSVAPATGGATELAELSGLFPSQVVVEPFMPVGPAFLDKTGLPRPGGLDDVDITLKGQIPAEVEFLGGETGTFHIPKGDHVLLVMLGSQPTVKAMQQYLDFVSNSFADAQQDTKTNWAFLACGKPTAEAYKRLYEESARKAAEFNAAAEAAGRRYKIVPFTGQPVEQLLGRADMTLTRSGGLTSGELLALAARGDRKKVLLHVEVSQDVAPTPPAAADAREAWEDELLEGGMVVWEAGNARHLVSTLGAELVTPAMPLPL